MAERAPIPAEEYERRYGQTNDSSSEFESCTEDAGLSGEDIPTTRLVSGLDLKEVCDTTGQGAEFEVESQLQMEEAALDNRYFDAEDVFQQLSRAPLDDESEDSSTEDLDMSPFERLSVKMESLCGDRGVVKKVVKQGVGDVVPAGAYVRVHYNGYLEYSDEPFDSSRLRNEELRFRLATGSVVPGMEIAISSMRKGERSRFLVQPNYGYGKFGCPPRIPGNATILYEIEMLNFVDRSTAEEFNSLTEALCELSEFDRSKGCLLKAQNLAPNNKDIREELKKLDRKFQQFTLLEKERCRKMFGGAKETKGII
uniref:peptidylprolyl isomerase n=1 Tax=Branchiostoma floridae TaxID=7739 RepID=C3Z9D8_BRAFL|eukprot:XP_002594856.1 hypothetical protein BRAFLDRAFT_86023 [Branchiostoma floridae]